MARVVDWTIAQEDTVSTSHTGVIPDYQPDDLLVWFVTKDGAAGPFTTPTDWLILSLSDDTSAGTHSRVFYKIAENGEPNPTTTTSSGDTIISILVSVRGVDTGDPIDVFADANNSGSLSSWEQVTTTGSNEIILFFAGCDQARTPTLIPGFHVMMSNDGTAICGCACWDFQRSAGDSRIPQFYRSAADDGVSVTIAVNDSGEGIVPPTLDTDAPFSTLIHPYNGTVQTSPFNGTFVSPLDTPWNLSTIDGITVASQAVSQTVDSGVNSYQNSSTISTAADGVLAGQVLALPSTIDLSGNTALAIHILGLSPRDVNEIGTVAERGIVVTLHSGTSNWRAYHVAAKNSIPTVDDRLTAVIDPSDTTTLLDAGGTLDVSAISGIGTLVERQLGTAAILFSQAHALHTGTIVNGSSLSPCTLKDLATYVNSNFCRSIRIQGDAELLSFMRIQIGNGSDDTYADIDSSALEFADNADEAQRQLSYHGVPGQIGISYYAKSTDTIRHVNSIISSKTDYYWRIESGSSSAANWNFTGLQIIGANPVTLQADIPINNVSFADCGLIDAAGAMITNCTISESAGSSALRVDSTSETNSGQISDLTFTDNTLGHSIEITATGSYTFDHILFSAGGPAQCTFDTQTDVNGSTEVITTDADHGYTTGEAVYYQDQGGSNDIGLTDGALYYIRAVGTDQLAFYATEADAIADVNRENLTTAGSSETHHLYSSTADVYNSSGGAVTINVTNGGSTPTIRNSNGSTTTVQNTVTLEINGVTEGARCHIEAMLGGPETSGTVLLNEEADSGGVAQEAYNFISDQPVRIRARLVGYLPFETTGTITSNGISVTAVWLTDQNIEP